MQSHFRYPILPNRRTRGGSSRNGQSGAMGEGIEAHNRSVFQSVPEIGKEGCAFKELVFSAGPLLFR
jgi:hypothetical protein